MRSTELKNIAREIFDETLKLIDVEAVVRQALRSEDGRLIINGESIPLSDYSTVLTIAIGKASVAMARAATAILGERLTAGLVVTNAIVGEAPARLPVFPGGHPTPNRESIEAANFALELLHRHDSPQTLILFLISGGGSAMFERPADPAMTLEDLQSVNRTLVGCGAVIGEMNTVRRRLSAVKGGRLADAAPASRQLSLYLSDVNSNDLAAVASGPTLPDPSSDADLARIVERYDLLSKFPPSAAQILATVVTTRKTPEVAAATRTHHLLLDNREVVAIASRIAADRFNLITAIADDLVEDEVQSLATEHLDRLAALQLAHPDRAVCLVSGGEAVCPVRGNGRGGRSQEFALRVALAIERRRMARVAVLAAGTDGIDGNSPAAGAVADDSTTARARAAGIIPEEALECSDSFSLFEAIGDSIITGPTGNNLRDLRLLISAP